MIFICMYRKNILSKNKQGRVLSATGGTDGEVFGGFDELHHRRHADVTEREATAIQSICQEAQENLS